jgi:MFS family permease
MRFAWTCDGYDYFAVPLTVRSLADAFGVSTVDITTSITLTLLFRSVGAVIFGVLADRFGRKVSSSRQKRADDLVDSSGKFDPHQHILFLLGR